MVENKSITGYEELEIEKETFYDLPAFFLNLRDQITKGESMELDAKEQPNVRRSTRSRKGGKQDVFDSFLDDDCDDYLTQNTKQSWHIYQTSEKLFNCRLSCLTIKNC